MYDRNLHRPDLFSDLPSTLASRILRTLVVTAGLASGLFGCSGGGMAPIDARTQRLLEGRTEAVGGNSIAPNRLWTDPGRLRDPEITEPTPGTVSPAAGELQYEPLPPEAGDEADEIERRLERFQELDVEGGLTLDLEEAFAMAQRSGREYLSAEEEYILAAISLLQERHLWNPRFFADVGASVGQDQTDGRFDTTLRVLTQLRATQRLPYGGEVAARWLWEATENLRSSATGQYTQSSRLILEGNVPLLRGAGLVAREDLIQAERNLVYAARAFERFRREYLVDLAQDYFRLLQQLAEIENQERSLRSLIVLEERQRALYDAGREREYEVNIAANRVLQARQSLANRRESFILALDQFKIRLGIPVETPVRLVPVELYIPEPATDPGAAARSALLYRLDLQNERDQVDDVRRQVRIARNRLLPELNVRGNVQFRTDEDEDEGGVVFEPDDTAWEVGADLSLPLDRRIERLQLRAEIIRLERTARELERFIDSVVLEARQRVREIERARLNLLLSDQQVAITERRQEEQRIREDEVTAQELVDTQDELIQARNARAQALTDLRIAVLQFLLATGQMRVDPSGDLLPLPGMEGAGVRPLRQIEAAELRPYEEPPPGQPTPPAEEIIPRIP